MGAGVDRLRAMGMRAYRAISADGTVGPLSAGDVRRRRGTDYGSDRLPPPPGRCGIDFMRMVSTMLGRRVGAGVVALTLALVIGLSGCAQGNTPTEYNTLTQQNFVELCTKVGYTLHQNVRVEPAQSCGLGLNNRIQPALPLYLLSPFTLHEPHEPTPCCRNKQSCCSE